MPFQEKINVDMADIHVEMKVTGKFFKLFKARLQLVSWARCGKDIYQKYVLILTDF